MQKKQTLGKVTFSFLIIAFAHMLSSCTEKISGVGSGYLRDTISSGIQTYSDSSTLVFTSYTKRIVTASARPFTINTGSPALIIGKISSATENFESWAALKIPILPDSITQILADSLTLRMRFAYLYGNSTDQNIDISIWTEPNNVVGDSTTSLTQGNLQKIVGTYHGSVRQDTLATITIGLDTGILNPLLRTASLSLVIVPNSSMNTLRAFASVDNGDNTYSPQLKLVVKGSSDISTMIRYPTNDFHLIVKDNFATPSGEFLVRGSSAVREHIVIRIDTIRNQLKLNPFVTINSALLQIRSDNLLHTSSFTPVDTNGPSLAYIPNTSIADSGHTFVDYGSHSTNDSSLYSFQIRSLVENALRTGADSLVLELRAGFAYRTISGSTVDVEDYNIDRWAFYGLNNTDKTKRPKLVLTYSYLR